MSGTIIGLFTRASDAEIALNNLDEAGYEPSTVSVVTADAARTRALTDAHGPLSQVAAGQLAARLVALGLSAADSGVYGQRTAAGQIFVAVEAPDGSENDAMEILTDQKAELVRSLPRK
jgi:hypothetical protein